MKEYPYSKNDEDYEGHHHQHHHHHHHHDGNGKGSGGKVRFSKRYVEFLDKVKVFVLLIWLICVGLSAWVAPKFISKTTDAFEPPAHSNASLANAAMSAAFPQTTIQSSIALYIAFNLTNDAAPPTDQIILSSNLQEFTMRLNQTVFEQGVPMFWNQTGIPTGKCLFLYRNESKHELFLTRFILSLIPQRQ